MEEMLHLFITQVPERLRSARAGVDEEEASETERAAHALRSSCAQLGAVRMQALCEEIERGAARGGLGAISGLIDELETEFERYRESVPDAVRRVETGS